MTTSTQTSPVITRTRAAVLHVVLNRGEARNPLGPDTIEALERALALAETDAGVRVVAVSAAGPAFSAGGNLGNLGERLAAPAQAGGTDPIALGNRRYGEFLTRFAKLPQTTIVVVQGPAMGGGAGLACAADLCIAGPQARFGFPEVSIGLVPGQILPFVAARIGAQAARRLMLTGERVDRDEAMRIGMVDYAVSDPARWEDELESVLKRCVDAAPRAVASTKQLIRQADGLGHWRAHGLPAYLDEAAQAFAVQMRRDALEGVAAAREKRAPRWTA